MVWAGILEAFYVMQNCVLMYDNASLHTAQIVRKQLNNADIDPMIWPALILDFNQIEHVLWENLERRIRAARIPPLAFRCDCARAATDSTRRH